MLGEGVREEEGRGEGVEVEGRRMCNRVRRRLEAERWWRGEGGRTAVYRSRAGVRLLQQRHCH